MEIRRVVAGEFFTNCYVVWGGKPGIAVLIDPADDAPGLLRLLDGLGLIPEAVLLTHGHYDHILAVPGLQARWPELPVWCHPLDVPQALTERDMGRVYPTVAAFSNLRPLEDGQRLHLAGLSIQALHTPGHTPGSVTFLTGDALFTGDTLFRGEIGRTDFAGGDDEQMASSLARTGGESPGAAGPRGGLHSGAGAANEPLAAGCRGDLSIHCTMISNMR